MTYVSKEAGTRAASSPTASSAGQDELAAAYADFNPFPAYFSHRAADPRQSRDVVDVLERETGLVRSVPDQQTGIDRLVDLTASCATWASSCSASSA